MNLNKIILQDVKELRINGFEAAGEAPEDFQFDWDDDVLEETVRSAEHKNSSCFQYLIN